MVPIVEFAYNNTHQATIMMTPFYYDLGRNVITPSNIDSRCQGTNDTADGLTERLRKITDDTIQRVNEARSRQEKYANEDRCDVEYEIGQDVLVDQQYLNLHDYLTATTKIIKRSVTYNPSPNNTWKKKIGTLYDNHSYSRYEVFDEDY